MNALLGENPFRKGAQSALDVLQRTETITPASFQIPGDTQKHFKAFYGIAEFYDGKIPLKETEKCNPSVRLA